MRNYFEIPAELKKTNLLTKSTNKKIDKIILYEFIFFTYRLKFDTNEIRYLI
jgi:hypothetical protein